MSAIELSNPVDPVHRAAREAEYISTAKHYDELEERQQFAEMFANLVMALQLAAAVRRYRDSLGCIFHELELHNKYKGQFFSPQSVADMMAEITCGEYTDEQPYETVYEPCSGSGVMVLGFANALMKRKYNPCQRMVVYAADLDIKCVHMTYIQLSLYGIPAVVVHSNTLTTEVFSRWYTPVYLLNDWLWIEPMNTTTAIAPEDEQLRRAYSPMYAAMRDFEALMPDPPPAPTAKVIPLTTTKTGQMSLF